MNKITDAITRSLFPQRAADKERATKRAAEEAAVHSYWVDRLETHINKAHRARYEEVMGQDTVDRDYNRDFATRYQFPDAFRKLSTDTLKMLEGYSNPTGIDKHALTDSEDLLRSALYIDSQGKKSEVYSIHSLMMGARALAFQHHLPLDITRLDPKHKAAACAAAAFITNSGLFDHCPPRLSEFVMERPDRMDDILEYVTTHCVGTDAAQRIDLDHVAEFLTSPSQPLREGAL